MNIHATKTTPLNGVAPSDITDISGLTTEKHGIDASDFIDLISVSSAVDINNSAKGKINFEPENMLASALVSR